MFTGLAHHIWGGVATTPPSPIGPVGRIETPVGSILHGGTSRYPHIHTLFSRLAPRAGESQEPKGFPHPPGSWGGTMATWLF